MADSSGTPQDNHVAQLRKNGENDAIKALFEDDGWLKRRVQNGDYEAYLRDLDIAWQIAHQEAEQQIQRNKMPTALVDCVLYALIQTTINSIMGTYPPALVKRALALDHWTTTHIQIVAKRIADPEQRIEIYRTLLDSEKLSDEETLVVQNKALAAAHEIDGSIARSLAYIDLAQYFAGHKQDEVITAAIKARPPSDVILPRIILPKHYPSLWQHLQHNISLILEMPPLLSPELRMSLFESALTFACAKDRIWVFRKLLPTITGNQKNNVIPVMFEEIIALSNESDRAYGIKWIAPHLSNTLTDHALDALEIIQDERIRSHALGSVAKNATASQQERIYQMTMNIKGERARASVLTDLIQYTLPELQGKTFNAVLATNAEGLISMALPKLKVVMDEKRISQMLSKVQSFKNDGWRSIGLANLSDHFDEPQRSAILMEAKQAALQENFLLFNMYYINDVMSKFDEEDRLELHQHRLNCAKALPERLCAETIHRIAEFLPATLLPSALEIATSFERFNDIDFSYHIAMKNLAPRLDESLLQIALQDAVNIGDGMLLDEILTDMPPTLISHPPSDQHAQFQDARLKLLKGIVNLREKQPREELFFLYKDMINDVVPDPLLAQIVNRTLIICREWHWTA